MRSVRFSITPCAHLTARLDSVSTGTPPVTTAVRAPTRRLMGDPVAQLAQKLEQSSVLDKKRSIDHNQ
jgi:hypothetical protein